MRLCLHQLFRPRRPVKIDNCGNCRECEPDAKHNPACGCYEPIEIHVYHVIGVPGKDYGQNASD